MSSLRRGHANLLCIVPILVYVLPKQVHSPYQLSCYINPLWRHSFTSFLYLHIDFKNFFTLHYDLQFRRSPTRCTLMPDGAAIRFDSFTQVTFISNVKHFTIISSIIGICTLNSVHTSTMSFSTFPVSCSWLTATIKHLIIINHQIGQNLQNKRLRLSTAYRILLNAVLDSTTSCNGNANAAFLSQHKASSSTPLHPANSNVWRCFIQNMSCNVAPDFTLLCLWVWNAQYELHGNSGVRGLKIRRHLSATVVETLEVISKLLRLHSPDVKSQIP